MMNITCIQTMVLVADKWCF